MRALVSLSESRRASCGGALNYVNATILVSCKQGQKCRTESELTLGWILATTFSPPPRAARRRHNPPPPAG